MITSKVLTSLKVPHFIIVEPQEISKYKEAIDRFQLLTTILELDMNFKNNYNLCDNLGLSKSTGPGPARNFAWEHSLKQDSKWHWVMDDNITSFRRLNKNEKVKVSCGAIFRAMEDFVLRYENVSMAGPNYFMFASARTKMPPFTTNTRIYSCNLIRNDLPFRWRGRYNEDTILSLDMLKAGWCTIQFNAFLQEKMPTQVIPGGNSTEFYFAEQGGRKPTGERYAKNGTLAKSQLLVDVYPELSKIVWKFGRWHHYVNYRPFKHLKLIRKKDLKIISEPNNYGMALKTIK